MGKEDCCHDGSRQYSCSPARPIQFVNTIYPWKRESTGFNYLTSRPCSIVGAARQPKTRKASHFELKWVWRKCKLPFDWSFYFENTIIRSLHLSLRITRNSFAMPASLKSRNEFLMWMPEVPCHIRGLMETTIPYTIAPSIRLLVSFFKRPQFRKFLEIHENE